MIELVKEPTSKVIIQKKHVATFDSATRVWELVFSLVRMGESLGKKAHLWIRWVVLAYYTRQLRSFRAIVLLLEHGLVPEAQKILRPMLETHLHLDFLVNAGDPVATARLYLAWEWANDEKLALILKYDKQARHKNKLKELQDLLSEERKKLGEDKWRQFLRCGPPMLSIEALARKQEFGAWYDTVYRRTSGPIHAFNILTYAQPEDEKMNLSLAPIDAELDITMEAATALLLETGLQVDRVLKLDQEEKLRKLDADISKEFKERRSKAG